MTFTFRFLFLLIALICFILAAVGIPSKVSLLAVGLVFFTLAFMVP
jgi:hypothetical protein